MIVEFFTVNGKKNIINKLSGATSTVEIEIVAPQIFNDFSISFSLKKAVKGNYARYNVNDITYVSSVTFDTLGNNQYQYNLSVDPIATAYYNDCLNVDSQIVRSQNGSGRLLFDTELTYSDFIDYTRYFFNDVESEPMFIVNIISAYVQDEARYPKLAGNLGIRSYVLTAEQMRNFTLGLNNMSDEDKKIYYPSIINMFQVSPQWIDTARYTSSTTVKLVASYGGSSSQYVYQAYDIAVSCLLLLDTVSEVNNFVTISHPVNIDITDSNINANMILSVRNVGDINFKPVDLDIAQVYGDNTIHTVGYSLALDPVSTQVVAYLNINGIRYNDKVVMASLPCSCPLAFQDYLMSYKEGFNVVSGLIGGIIAGGVGFAVGGPVGAAALGGMVGSWAGFVDWGREQRTSGRKIMGNAGSSPDTVCSLSSCLSVYNAPPLNKEKYQSIFGKPDKTVRNISTLTGYIRTANVRLNLNGLNESIVEQAEAVLNSGAYMI